MASTPLDDATYINLRSYRRDGSPVDTPIWQAPLDGHLVAYTDGRSYKVKRLRRNRRVQAARCTVRGAVLGPWLDGSTELVERGSALERRAYVALRKKYGWLIRIGSLLSFFSGRQKHRQVLRITLDGFGAGATRAEPGVE